MCVKCNDTGTICFKENGIEYGRQCECVSKKKSLQRLEKSGLKNIAERCTFNNFTASTEWQQQFLSKAKAFIESNSWFYVGGQVGCGKTHICTAIVTELINRGQNAIYMQWRDEIGKLKDYSETAPRLDIYKNCDILYIDDLFKGGSTEADIRIAFEILNYRYNNDKRTVISSEFTLRELGVVDEGLASRIYEKGKDFISNIEKDKSKNWRLKT